MTRAALLIAPAMLGLLTACSGSTTGGVASTVPASSAAVSSAPASSASASSSAAAVSSPAPSNSAAASMSPECSDAVVGVQEFFAMSAQVAMGLQGQSEITPQVKSALGKVADAFDAAAKKMDVAIPGAPAAYRTVPQSIKLQAMIFRDWSTKHDTLDGLFQAADSVSQDPDTQQDWQDTIAFLEKVCTGGQKILG